MAKRWTCNEHDCGFEATADDLETLIELANEHMRAAHDSYELEEMIEDAAIDVDG